jgi:group I intron endonuclease
MKYYIYRHILNNKSYIGYTKTSIATRLKQHIRAAKKGQKTYFSNAIRKYGTDNIITECVEILDCENNTLPQKREKYWIEFYDSFENGYNLTKGGEGGDTWTKNPNKEETRKKLKETSTGRRHTSTTKNKMREIAYNRGPMPREYIEKAEAKRQIKRATGEYISKDGIERLRAIGKNKVFDKEYRRKLSERAKKRPKVTCPHCGKIGIKNSMMRWHFDNCKLKGM